MLHRGICKKWFLPDFQRTRWCNVVAAKRKHIVIVQNWFYAKICAKNVWLTIFMENLFPARLLLVLVFMTSITNNNKFWFHVENYLYGSRICGVAVFFEEIQQNKNRSCIRRFPTKIPFSHVCCSSQLVLGRVSHLQLGYYFGGVLHSFGCTRVDPEKEHMRQAWNKRAIFARKHSFCKGAAK